MNHLSLVGRLVRDPEHRQGRLNRADFTLSIPRRRGGVVELPVIAYGDLADAVASCLTKGRLVAVEGLVQTSSAEGCEQARAHLELVASTVEFLGATDERPK